RRYSYFCFANDRRLRVGAVLVMPQRNVFRLVALFPCFIQQDLGIHKSLCVLSQGVCAPKVPHPLGCLVVLYLVLGMQVYQADNSHSLTLAATLAIGTFVCLFAIRANLPRSAASTT